MMRRVRWGFGICALAAFAVQAADEPDLSARSHASAAASGRELPAAPFVAARDPLPELMRIERAEQAAPRGCDRADRSLCYDASVGHMVYRGAREYMPRFEGLRPESMSLRRDRLVLRYSFR